MARRKNRRGKLFFADELRKSGLETRCFVRVNNVILDSFVQYSEHQGKLFSCGIFSHFLDCVS